MDEFEELKDKMRTHGFYQAAHELWKAKSLLHIIQASDSWDDYPECMKKYPSKLSKRTI